jgi:hypothetical protein
VLPIVLAFALAAADASTPPAPELFLPDVIATEGSEVKAAFTPDGNCVFWGSIPKQPDGHGWDILYSCKDAGGRWTPAARAPFDTDANEFDPAVSPDGKTIWFFSNRPGGLGGDDIWSVSFDQAAMRFGPAVNAGAQVNSAGADWAPAPMPDGRLLFASDGWGGHGKHDLFYSPLDGTPPINLGPEVNGPEDDFDAAWLGDDAFGAVIFARGDAEAGTARLMIANEEWHTTEDLGPVANCSDELNTGPSVNIADPGYLYVSAYCPSIGKGRMDIFRVPIPALSGDPAGPRPPAPSR